MIGTRVAALLSLGALAWAVAWTAAALPRAGETFPSFTAADVTGQKQQSASFLGHGTLVVAITDRHGGDAMQAWYETADRRMPESVRRLSILSFDLPFFVSLKTAQGKARNRIPERYWHDSLLDRDGAMAKALGMEESPLPFVLALDPSGRVLASFHGGVQSSGADSIWAAFSSLAPPTKSP